MAAPINKWRRASGSRRGVTSSLVDGTLVLGATMRLTRLVVTDDLGAWLGKDRAKRWAASRRPQLPTLTHAQGPIYGEAWTWRDKLVSGLDCPFCVGTWIGYAVLLGTVSLREDSRLGRGWRFVLTGLALNEVVGHLAARLGDTAE